MPDKSPPRAVADLIAVMAALRTPVTGCPWDLEQDFASIAPYTIEEAYEVADAIARADMVDLKEELGDLLLQVVYHARLAEEKGAFAFADVADGIVAKMVRRHPHVFGDEEARTAGMAKGAWERIKAEEKAEKAAAKTTARLSSPPVGEVARSAGGGKAAGTEVGAHSPPPLRGTSPARGEEFPSLLDDVPVGMPSLTRAVKLQDKAAKVGFDWPSLAPVLAKMREELAELEGALGRGVSPSGSDILTTPTDARTSSNQPSAPGVRPGGSDTPIAYDDRLAGTGPPPTAEIEEELGDLLFVMANVARHLKLDPEAALRRANDKFRRRFAYIEAELRVRGRTPAQSSLEEMDAIWNEVRARDKA